MRKSLLFPLITSVFILVFSTSSMAIENFGIGKKITTKVHDDIINRILLNFYKKIARYNLNRKNPAYFSSIFRDSKDQELMKNIIAQSRMNEFPEARIEDGKVVVEFGVHKIEYTPVHFLMGSITIDGRTYVPPEDRKLDNVANDLAQWLAKKRHKKFSNIFQLFIINSAHALVDNSSQDDRQVIASILAILGSNGEDVLIDGVPEAASSKDVNDNIEIIRNRIKNFYEDQCLDATLSASVAAQWQTNQLLAYRNLEDIVNNFRIFHAASLNPSGRNGRNLANLEVMKRDLKRYLGYDLDTQPMQNPNCENILGPHLPNSYLQRNANNEDAAIAEFCAPIKQLENCLVALRSDTENISVSTGRGIASEGDSIGNSNFNSSSGGSGSHSR